MRLITILCLFVISVPAFSAKKARKPANFEPAKRIGTLEKKVVNIGSHGEREAIVMVDRDGGELILRTKSSGFGIDPELEKLIGKPVKCSGFVSDNSSDMIVTDCKESN